MTKYVDLRFYGELSDFLHYERTTGTVRRSFDVAGSVKDMIEACGVPHTEVAMILAHGARSASGTGCGTAIGSPCTRRFEVWRSNRNGW